MNKRRLLHGLKERTKNGKTYYVVSVSGGVDVFGRRVRPERWCSSIAEAKKALRSIEREVENGTSSARGNDLLVVDYLREWIAALTIRESSAIRYGYSVANMKPYLLRLHVKDFCTSGDGVERVQSIYRKMRSDGASDSKVRKAHTTLSAALSDAVPRHIRGNPCLLIPKRQKPKQNSPPRDVYGPDELARFAAAIVGDRLEALYALALSLMRQGEILALKRKNVDLERGLVYVTESLTDMRLGRHETGPPKSKDGVRYVALPPFALEALRRHLGPAGLLLRGAAGSPLVFPNQFGKTFDRANLLKREYYPLLDQAGLRRITFHDLRHAVASAASHLAPALALKQQLGHGSLTMTAHYGGHHGFANGEAVAAAIGSLFPPAVGGKLGGKPISEGRWQA